MSDRLTRRCPDPLDHGTDLDGLVSCLMLDFLCQCDNDDCSHPER